MIIQYFIICWLNTVHHLEIRFASSFLIVSGSVLKYFSQHQLFDLVGGKPVLM